MDKRVFEAQAQLDADIELAENATLLEHEARKALQEKALDDIVGFMINGDFAMLDSYASERGVDMKTWIYDRYEDDGVYEYFVAGNSAYSYIAITNLCGFFDLELWETA